MALKAIIEGADNVPEALKASYVEKDGKFVLDLDEDVKEHPLVAALSNAYRKEQAKRRELSTKVDELQTQVSGLPEGFDADEWARLKAGDEGKKPDEQIQALKDQHHRSLEALRQKHAKELQTRDEKFTGLEGEIDNSLVSNGLKDALLESGVNPDLLAGALGIVRGRAKVLRTDKGERKAVAESDLGEELPVSEFVKTWLTSKEGKPYLGKPEGPAPRGNNHTNGVGAKTIRRAEFNQLDATAQMKAMTVDNVQVID